MEKKVFFQLQFSVPTNSIDTIQTVLEKVSRSCGSFLTVLKKFGEKSSGGLLSFPSEGYTLTLDFPNRGSLTKKQVREFEEIIMASGGRIYLAKDGLMSSDSFRNGYTQIDKFKGQKDPVFSSSMWRRLGVT